MIRGKMLRQMEQTRYARKPLLTSVHISLIKNQLKATITFCPPGIPCSEYKITAVHYNDLIAKLSRLPSPYKLGDHVLAWSELEEAMRLFEHAKEISEEIIDSGSFGEDSLVGISTDPDYRFTANRPPKKR